ncbi:hypothetical protein [Haliangium ochraceum]|nr:hypothetical protein [Haliangium ochraceum]
MDQRFTRANFDAALADTDVDDAQRAAEFARVLSARLQAARDRWREVDAIVRDLRALGHDIHCWDDGEDYSIWGDHQADGTRKNRLLVTFRPDDSPPEVDIDFRPWPLARDRRCTFCGSPMRATAAVVQVHGHGSVQAPPAQVELWFGEQIHEQRAVGVQSFRWQANGLSCESCGGLWFPSNGTNKS